MQVNLMLYSCFWRQHFSFLKHIVISINNVNQLLLEFRITSRECFRFNNIFSFNHQQHKILTRVYKPFHLTNTNKRYIHLLGMCSNYIFKSIFKNIIFVLVTTLVKIPCNKVNKGKIITKVMGHIFQAKCWAKHPSVGVHLVYYG